MGFDLLIYFFALVFRTSEFDPAGGEKGGLSERKTEKEEEAEETSQPSHPLHTPPPLFLNREIF